MSEPRWRWEDKGLDEHAANELYLYTSNDGDLYRQSYTPIIKNLATKKARGTYQSGPAAKLFGYLVENGAKKYYAEEVEGKRVSGAFTQNVGSGWHDMFPKNLRDAVAEEFRDHFEVEYDLGNYNNESFLPKKYLAKYSVAKKGGAGGGKRKPTASLGGTR
jgi:hypothetical protein